MSATAFLLLGFVTLQRLSELVLARRNTARLLAKGGVEHGQGHFPLMVALHASWLASLWLLSPGREVLPPLIVIYALCQVLRLWILTTLGRRWTTRIITIPGERLVARGPYRFMRHPNYALVAVEIPLLPMVFGLWQLAFIFAVLNFAMLTWRIRVENSVLKGLNRS